VKTFRAASVAHTFFSQYKITFSFPAQLKQFLVYFFKFGYKLFPYPSLLIKVILYSVVFIIPLKIVLTNRVKIEFFVFNWMTFDTFQ
jgi:hypothetical protein